MIVEEPLMIKVDLVWYLLPLLRLDYCHSYFVLVCVCFLWSMWLVLLAFRRCWCWMGVFFCSFTFPWPSTILWRRCSSSFFQLPPRFKFSRVRLAFQYHHHTECQLTPLPERFGGTDDSPIQERRKRKVLFEFSNLKSTTSIWIENSEIGPFW